MSLSLLGVSEGGCSSDDVLLVGGGGRGLDGILGPFRASGTAGLCGGVSDGREGLMVVFLSVTGFSFSSRNDEGAHP